MRATAFIRPEKSGSVAVKNTQPTNPTDQMNHLLSLAACALFSISICFASHEQAIGASSLVYRIAELNLELTVDCESGGTLKSLVVKTPEFTCTVPKAELDGLGDKVDLGSLKFLVRFTDSGQKLAKSHLALFAISFACGPMRVNDENGKEIHASNEVRFEFYNNAFKRRLRCVSDGDDKNAWRVFQKDTGEQEVELKDHHKTHSAKNPWRE